MWRPCRGFAWGQGRLYTTLARLQQQGWIEALSKEEARRPYRLTDAGRKVLQVQLRRLESFTASGLAPKACQSAVGGGTPA
jgi:DNA-binding PadR family transcriptional regulator